MMRVVNKKVIQKLLNSPQLLNTKTMAWMAESKPFSYYYRILGLKPGYTQDQLKNAYLEMVKKYHPDLSTEPNAKQMFQEIQEAYDILQDPSKRPKGDESDGPTDSSQSTRSGTTE